MSRKVIRHSRAAKPAAQFTLSLEDRRKFVAFFEILIAIDNRLKKAKKSKKKDADMPYGLDDSITNLIGLQYLLVASYFLLIRCNHESLLRTLMNKLTLTCLFLAHFSMYPVLTKIDGTSEVLKNIESMGKQFAQTGSSSTKGPDINKLAQKDRIFFAKMDLLGFGRYFEFENQTDADEIQMGCHNGGSMSVVWYYVDALKKEEQKKD